MLAVWRFGVVFGIVDFQRGDPVRRGRVRIVDRHRRVERVGPYRADVIGKDIDIGATGASFGGIASAGSGGIRRAGVQERISAFDCPVLENRAAPDGVGVAAAFAGIAQTERVNVCAAGRRRRWLST
jgi:hypothetical protein